MPATCWLLAGWDTKVRLWDFKSVRELINIVGGGLICNSAVMTRRLACHFLGRKIDFEVF